MLASWLMTADVGEVMFFFAVVNVSLVIVSALLWTLLRQICRQRVFEIAKPISLSDVIMTSGAIVMNVLFSIAGWKLWRLGWLTLAPASSISLMTFLSIAGQLLLMLLVMDFGMYVTHRIAHLRSVYPWLHRAHHEHVETNALSLFVLSPLEVFGFGGLILLAIFVVRPSELALTSYLLLNVIVGTAGHSGVRLFSAGTDSHSPWHHWDSSAFHAGHHTDKTVNFGFYSPLWDALFGTLHVRSTVQRRD